MLRVLVVLGFGAEPDLDAYRSVFHDAEVWVTREDDAVGRTVCDTDPHVVVSLGHDADTNMLWQMPVWRRSRWLSLPDASLDPEDVRRSCLSLLAATVDQSAFRDAPLVSVVPLDPTVAGVIRAARWTTEQSYDNVEILVPVDAWNDVRDACTGGPAAMRLRRAGWALRGSALDKIRLSQAMAQGRWFLPVNGGEVDAHGHMIECLVREAGRAVDNGVTGAGSVIAGVGASAGAVLGAVGRGGGPEIGHLLLSRTQLAATQMMHQSLPLHSLGLLLAGLCADPSTTFLDSDEDERLAGRTISGSECGAEPEQAAALLLRGPLGWAHRAIESRREPAARDDDSHTTSTRREQWTRQSATTP